MDRYFLVSYHAKINTATAKCEGFGQMDFSTNGVYLNKRLTQDQIQDRLRIDLFKGRNVEMNVVILNINEVSRSDWETYSAEPKM